LAAAIHASGLMTVAEYCVLSLAPMMQIASLLAV
jgi:hypothetical protein